jgi:hypothetical protein
MKRQYTEEERREIVRKTDKLSKKGFNKMQIAQMLHVKYGSLTGFYFRYHGHGIPKNL